MNYLTQIILAVNHGNGESADWMQILVIIVVGIFWAIGAFLKARANKLKDTEDRQQPLRERPSRPTQRSGLQQIRYPSTKPVRAEPKPIARKVPVGTTPQIKPKPSVIHPDLKKPKKFIAEPIKGLKDKIADIPLELEPTKPGIALGRKALFRFDDPDQLKRAILHYEILGKPLSLRNPSEHIIES